VTATATIISRRRHIRGQAYIAYVAFSGNYTASGDSIAAADLGLSKLDMVQVPGCFAGATHTYFFSVVPTTPDANGRFTAFTLNIKDMLDSTGATADLTAGAYPAALTGITPGIYIQAIGF